MTTLFKKIIDREIPAKIIYEDDECLAFLDIAQGTPGHTLVIPKKEVVNAMDADESIVAMLNVKAIRIAKILKEKLHCSGFNFISNAGEDAGQTVLHYHIHIVPRWSSDELHYVFKGHEADIEATYNLLVNK